MTRSTPVRSARRPTYTPEAANRALPLLRAIARDAHTTYLRVRARLAAQDGRRPLEDLSRDTSLPDALRDDLATLHDLMRELAELGARLADPELGIVLLDALVDGRPSYLCWKIGEDAVRTWFPIDGRYEDRRPLPAPGS